MWSQTCLHMMQRLSRPSSRRRNVQETHTQAVTQDRDSDLRPRRQPVSETCGTCHWQCPMHRMQCLSWHPFSANLKPTAHKQGLCSREFSGACRTAPHLIPAILLSARLGAGKSQRVS